MSSLGKHGFVARVIVMTVDADIGVTVVVVVVDTLSQVAASVMRVGGDE